MAHPSLATLSPTLCSPGGLDARNGLSSPVVASFPILPRSIHIAVNNSAPFIVINNPNRPPGPRKTADFPLSRRKRFDLPRLTI